MVHQFLLFTCFFLCPENKKRVFQPDGQGEPQSKKQKVDPNHNVKAENQNSNQPSSFKAASELKQEEVPEITPLKQITKFRLPTFTVRGQFTHLSPLRHISVRGRQTSYFHGIFVDQAGTEKKVNFWGDDAIKMNALLKTVTCYLIFGLKPYFQKRQNYQLFGPIELTWTSLTKCEEAKVEETVLILCQMWKFVLSIKKIRQKQTGTKVDTIGFVGDLEDVSEITTKYGKKTNKRKFTLFDETAKITVTLWGQQTEVTLKIGQIVAIKQAQINDYAGRSLTVRGHIELEPKHTRVMELQQWKAEQNTSLKLLLQKLETLSDGKIGIGEVDWKAAQEITIVQAMQMRETFIISNKEPSVQNFILKAKVIDIDQNLFYSKNNEPAWKLNLTLTSKESEEIWVKAIAFGEAASKFMKKTAKEASDLQTNDVEAFEEYMLKRTNSSEFDLFYVKTKVNEWQGNKRLDFIVQDIEKQKN